MISYELDVPPRGTKVIARGRKRPSGVTTGGTPLTYPCLGGMQQHDDGTLEIV